MTKVNPAVHQNAYRARNDDGTETTATWKAAQNTTWTQLSTETFRLRFLLEEEAGAQAKSVTFDLQATRDGGVTWENVGTNVAGCVYALGSPNVTDTTPTTQQITGGTGTFQAGEVSADGITAAITIASGGQCEVEYICKLGPTAVNNDLIDLRVRYGDATNLEAYNAIPRLTASVPPPTNIAPARIGLSVSTPKNRNNHSYGVEGAKSAENSGTMTVALFEGATERASNKVGLTSTASNHSFTLTNAQASAIADYSLLELRISAASNSGAINAEVAEAWIKVPESDSTTSLVSASDAVTSSILDEVASVSITNLGEDLVSSSLTEQASVVVLGVDVSDNFDRPDNLTDLGTDWNTYTLDNALTISANQVAPKSLLQTGAMHKTLTTNDDQLAEVTIVTGGGDSMGIILNAPNTIGANDTDTGAYYLFRYSGTEWRILQKSATAASFTTLASLVKAETFPLTFRAERQGTTLRIVMGTTEILAVNLTSALTGQNRVGLRNSNSTTMRFDNFRFADNPPLAGTVEKTTSDSLTSSLSESMSFGTIEIVGSDSVSTGITESTAVESAGPANDLIAASLTETASIEKTGLFEYSASDIVVSSITEESLAATVIIGSDTTAAGITDTVEPIVISGEVTVTASDDITSSVTDSSTIVVTDVAASDTVSSTLAEATAITTAGPASDLISPSLTETTSIEKTGTFEYNASDITATSVTDEALVEIVIVGSDSIATSLNDLTEPVNMILAASDITASSVAESYVMDVSAASSDNLAVSATDTTLTDVTFDSSDSVGASLNELASVLVTDIAASDTISSSLVETTATETAGPASDLISPSITESATLEKSGLFEYASSETLVTSITEQNYLPVIISATDTMTTSVSDLAEPIVASGVSELVASETVATSITDISSVIILVSTVDSLTASVTESSSFATIEVVGNDNVSTSLTETMDISASLSASDSIAAGIVDISEIVTAAPGEDIISASITETASIVADGFASVTAADTTTVYIDDQSVVLPILSVADTILTLVDETAVTFVTLNSSDSIAANLNEGGEVFLDFTTSDIIVASITETASQVTAIVASDSLVSSLTELATVLNKVKKVKVWNGTAYVAGVLKVWNGSAWHIPRIYVWDGQQWI